MTIFTFPRPPPAFLIVHGVSFCDSSRKKSTGYIDRNINSDVVSPACLANMINTLYTPTHPMWYQDPEINTILIL